MDKRIRELRKTLDFTQQELADRLNIKRGAVANYEIGRNEPIDAVISLICREFNVSEEWLRTGAGDMFNVTLPEDETAAIVSDLLEEENPFYDLIIGITKTYGQLNPRSQEVLQEFAVQLLNNLQTKKED